ncbi:MAG: dipeptidase [Clostridiales bacterium]|nr:dipeptidase [Clostridiales bacterium]
MVWLKETTMQFIDMHCDTLMILYAEDPEKAELYDSAYTSIDFKRMQEGGELAQFFAIFLPSDEYRGYRNSQPLPDNEYIDTLRNYLMKNLEKYPEIIAWAKNAEDVRKNQKAGKMSAILTMEDGRAVDGRMENLEKFYDMGFRALSLTWNYHNCFGAPNSRDPEIMNQGLTDFGKEAVRYMQELGMLVDVSHLSDGGFYDVADICKKPFVATHSNARAISPHPRNLTDEMIRILGNAGGVTGINFAACFLNEDITCKDSTAVMMARHARHIADVGGVDCVGIGTDFDGIGGNLEISDCAHMSILEDALSKEGFTGNEIEKIFYKNVFRVMEDAMR